MKTEQGTILPAVRERFGLKDGEKINAHIIVSGAPKGRKRRAYHQHDIEQEMLSYGIDTKLYVTKDAQDAKELTKNAIKDNAHVIVYYSGDGGFHTGVNVQEQMLGLAAGMKDPTGKEIQKPINIFVPGGTMDIAGRANNIPRRRVKKAIKQILTGEIVDRDLIKMTAGDKVLHGVTVVGFGAAATVTNHVDTSGKRGPQRYLIESWKHRKEIKPREVIFSNANKWGDEYKIPVWVGEVMNGGPYGGWFHTLPNDTKLDDGKLDMFAVEPAGAFFPQAIKLALRTRARLTNGHMPLPDFLRGMRGDKIIARTADGKAFGPIHADGESTTTDASVIVFESKKHAMTQAVPKQKAA